MIKVEDLTIKFKDRTIFEKWNGTFNTGEIISITGASGKGKSTLLRSIAGLIKPNSGTITYNGVKIKKPNNQIFMMHQNYTNFPWKDCMENVLFPLRLQRKLVSKDIDDASEILKKVGLIEHAFKFPDELSGGMKQRLALARVLVSKPPVILMDEPLSALDEKTRGSMQKLILDMHKETSNTIIMVTHSNEEALKMSDSIINI